MVVNQGQFYPLLRANPAIFGKIFGKTQRAEGGGACNWHLIGRGLGCAKHPTVHRTGPCALSSPNVSGAEVEKPCFRLYLHGKNKY